MTLRLPLARAALLVIATMPACAAQTTRPQQLAAESFCNAYARNAVIQYRQARYWQCDKGGNRWSDNWGDHLKWCNSVHRGVAERELQIRDEELEGCRNSMKTGSTTAALCRDYAAHAVRLVEQAKQLRCNFGGARWSPSYDGHYGWCLRANAGSRGFERRKRDTEIDACRSARR
jgi:hypothetical protein